MSSLVHERRRFASELEGRPLPALFASELPVVLRCAGSPRFKVMVYGRERDRDMFQRVCNLSAGSVSFTMTRKGREMPYALCG